jgi:hypothetical protein
MGFLSSLLVCTWTVQLLRIPQAASKRKSLRCYWSHWGEEIWLQFKWIILTLLIPELLAGKELQDLIMARRSCRGMDPSQAKMRLNRVSIKHITQILGGMFLSSKISIRAKNKHNQSCEKVENPVQHDAKQNPAARIAVVA